MILKTRLHTPEQAVYRRNTLLGNRNRSLHILMIWGIMLGCLGCLAIGELLSRMFAVYIGGTIISYLIFLWATKSVVIERTTSSLSERYHEFNDECIITYGSLGHYRRMKLSSVVKVVRTSQGYELFFSNDIANTLPADAFDSDHDRQTFEALIEKHHLFAEPVVPEDELHLLIKQP